MASPAASVAASELGRPVWPGTYQKTTHLSVQGHLAQNLGNKDNYGVYEKQVILPKEELGIGYRSLLLNCSGETLAFIQV